MEKKYYELFDKILQYIKGKKVLDLGCVDHNIKETDKPLWLHGFLNKYSKVTGIDILKEELIELKKRGYNVKYGDAENLRLKEKFDVIIAGELIEHLSNPGMFLKGCKKHLKKDGLLIITTPNTFNICENLCNVFLMINNPSVNPQHICYYTPTTIKELLERNGFKVKKIDYFDFYGTLIGKIRFLFLSMLGNKHKRRMVVFAESK